MQGLENAVMALDDQGKKRPICSCGTTRVHRGKDAENLAIDIPTEHVINVFANRQRIMVVTCTPTNIRELVVGRLFTEGFIECLEQVISMEFCDATNSAYVTLQNGVTAFPKLDGEYVDTCGAGTRSLAGKFRQARAADWIAEAELDPEQIFYMADIFANDTPLHESTLGVHSCSLFRGREQICSFEDLGRHNALDKAIGAALLDGRDMSTLTIFSSGRIPMDMIYKAIRARVPVLVTKATPTSCAVSIARKHGLILIGRARPDSFCIFSAP